MFGFCNGKNNNSFDVWCDSTAYINRTNPKEGDGKATDDELTADRLAKMWGLK